MIYFINNCTNPYYNLALEEVLIKSDIKENILLLWQNYNTIVIGRNQNAYEEIKIDKANEDNVKIVRRQSGGGAVFQDFGNLCFSFIVNADQKHSYQEMCAPVIKTLNRLGVSAKFEGKNDIKVGGKKISGNAQYLYRNRLLHHGTILFDVDLSRLSDYLVVDRGKLKSKGIKSNHSAVTNIKDLFTDKTMTIAKLQTAIMDDLALDNVNVQPVPLDIESKAKALAEKKYDTWRWKFGVFPQFSYYNKHRFVDKGSVTIYADINKGLIENIKFYGDFVGAYGTEELEQQLVGTKYNIESVTQIIAASKVHQIFGANFTANEIVKLIMNIKLTKKQ